MLTGPPSEIFLQFALPALRLDVQCVFARFVGEIGDRLPVGGPRRAYAPSRPGVLVRLRISPFSAGTVMISPCASKTARTPVGEMRPFRDFPLDVLKARPHLTHVGIDLDGHRPALSAGQVVKLDLPELLVDDPARTGAGRANAVPLFLINSVTALVAGS